MKNVACYCRVSTEEQVKFGFSISAQKSALEKYCKDNNYKYEFYIDEGISASSMKKRRALQEMLDKINEFDIVLFTKLDRLSRNVLDANNINKILQENNCTMKAIDEDDVDTSTADGMFIFNLKVSLAQREIEKTSERIKFVFKDKRNKGEITSGQKKYGYDIINKHYVVNETEADNIRKLYKYFIDVNGDMKKVYDYFITNFNGKGYDALSKYLRETSYIGKYRLYRRNEYVDNYIPAILDTELFNGVQKILGKKGYQTKSNIIALFAGILYCADCKHKLSKRTDNRTKNKTMRYVCYNSARYKVSSFEHYCTNSLNIREDYIENYLLDNFNEEAKKYIVKKKNITTNAKTANNTNEIKKKKKKLEKLKDLYIDDLIDKETYRIDYDNYTSKIVQLEKENNEKHIVRKNFDNIEKLLKTDIKKIYSNLNKENKRKFWLSVIDKIYIKDGKIQEITFL